MTKFIIPEARAPFQVNKGAGQKFVVPENAPPSGPTGSNR